MILSIAAILYSISAYRDNAERSRIDELQIVNRELEGAKSSLESRLQESTAELSARTDELAQRSRALAEANFRLDRRSAQFEAISQVSRSIASFRDLQSLLPGIASVISRSFDFYHVGIFLIDANREYATLSAANSEGGQRMLARQHRLQVGQEGIVGFVAAKGQPRIALDVGEDAVFFNNPDLPETHSEMGLPLKKSEAVIGVLDVQSTKINAFSHEDIDLLLLLADQVSLALENARLFDDARRALAEAESFSRQHLREGWGRLASEHQMLGYRFDRTGASPLSRPVEIAPAGSLDESPNQVGVPIELRGEVIGSLVVQAPPGKKWTQDELDLIRAVAERVALSAENARLFEETSRRAERERLVSDITSRIRSSNDPNEMIKLAVQELKSALGVTRVEVIPQRVSTGPKHGES
jgi:GAF domain-containing protein